MKKMIYKFFIYASVLLSFTLAHGYEVLQGPTEMLLWDKKNAYNGYTLFAAGNMSFLIDMEGNVINTWPIGKNPRLLDNGNLLDATKAYKGLN